MTVNTWRVARESTEFAGPLAVTVTADGTPVPGADVEIAVLLHHVRPVEADWRAPDVDPDGSGALGVQCNPVAEFGVYGIWLRVTDTPEAPVLEPGDVGWIRRT